MMDNIRKTGPLLASDLSSEDELSEGSFHKDGDPLIGALKVYSARVGESSQSRLKEYKCRSVKQVCTSPDMPQLQRESLQFSPISPGQLSDEEGRGELLDLNSSLGVIKQITPLGVPPVLRVDVGGLVSLVMKRCYHKMSLEFNETDLQILQALVCGIPGSTKVFTTVMATIQALICTPSVGRSFLNWAEASNRVVVLPPNSAPCGAGAFHPWKPEALWDFRVWSLATQVINKFLSIASLPSESEFVYTLRDLYRQTPGSRMEVDAIVATLFMIRDASWLWPLLMAFCEM